MLLTSTVSYSYIMADQYSLIEDSETAGWMSDTTLQLSKYAATACGC